MDRVEGAELGWTGLREQEESGGRKKKRDKRKEMGERWLGKGKEKRGWRKEEEIRNKGNKVGEGEIRSPSGYIC